MSTAAVPQCTGHAEQGTMSTPFSINTFTHPTKHACVIAAATSKANDL